MIETLLGGLLGGAFRLAPEILKGLDRQGERGHELAMQDKALELAEDKEAIEKFGSSDSGASLGDILGAALREKAQKD